MSRHSSFSCPSLCGRHTIYYGTDSAAERGIYSISMVMNRGDLTSATCAVRWLVHSIKVTFPLHVFVHPVWDQVQADVAAIAMEEVLPSSVADADALAPEEIYAKKRGRDAEFLEGACFLQPSGMKYANVLLGAGRVVVVCRRRVASGLAGCKL